MKLHITLFVSLILFFGSCKKDDPEKEGPCGLKNPIEELAWLKKDIELFSTPPSDISSYAYFTAVYKRERVFWLYFAFNSSFNEYRTCDGKRYYISNTDDDDETKRFRAILRSPNKYCEYLLWSNKGYKVTSGGCN